MTLFELAAVLKLDKSGFDKGTEDAKSKFGGLGTFLSTTAKAAGVSIAAMGTAVYKAGQELWSLANQTATAGDHIDKMSQKIGISAQAYQEWQYVFDRSGASIDGLQMGMKTLSGVITQAGNGSKEAAAKLAAIGLSYDDIKNKSPDDQLALVISKLQSMDAGATRTSAATELLGRSATDMAAVLNMTAAETDALKQETHDYGMVMSDEAVASSAAFQDSLTKAQYTVTGLKNRMIGELLPGLSMVVDGFSDLVTGSDTAGTKLQTGFGMAISSLTSLLPKAIAIVSSIATAVLQSAPQIITSLAQGIMNSVSQLAPVALKVIGTLVSNLASMLPQLISTGVQVLLSLINGITSMIPSLISSGLQIINALITAIKNNLPSILSAGITLVTSLITGIINALPSLISSATTLITSLLNAIIGAIPQFIQAGFNLLTALITNLPAIIIKLLSAIPTIISSLVSSILSNIPKIMQTGVQFFTSLITRLPEIIRTLLSGVGKIIADILKTLMSSIPQIISAGFQLFISLIANLPQAIGYIVSHLPEIIWAIVQGIMSGFGSIVEVGKMLVEGLWEGIKNMGNWLWNQITGWFGWIIDGIKWIFGISSPSKVFADIGKQLDAGLGQGIERNADMAMDPLVDLAEDMSGVKVEPNLSTADTLTGTRTSAGYGSVTININGADKDPEQIAREVQRVFVDWERQQGAVFA